MAAPNYYFLLETPLQEEEVDLEQNGQTYTLVVDKIRVNKDFFKQVEELKKKVRVMEDELEKLKKEIVLNKKI